MTDYIFIMFAKHYLLASSKIRLYQILYNLMSEGIDCQGMLTKFNTVHLFTQLKI